MSLLLKGFGIHGITLSVCIAHNPLYNKKGKRAWRHLLLFVDWIRALFEDPHWPEKDKMNLPACLMREYNLRSVVVRRFSHPVRFSDADSFGPLHMVIHPSSLWPVLSHDKPIKHREQGRRHSPSWDGCQSDTAHTPYTLSKLKSPQFWCFHPLNVG